jgi:hypothetical protein
MNTMIEGGGARAEIEQVGRFDYSISIRSDAAGPPVDRWYRFGRVRAERKASLELLRYVSRLEWEAGPVVVYRAGV